MGAGKLLLRSGDRKEILVDTEAKVTSEFIVCASDHEYLTLRKEAL